MRILSSDCPRTLNNGCPEYRMPGEFEPHAGCILIWPERPGSFPYEAKPARKAFATLIQQIAKSEFVYLAVSETSKDSALTMLFDGCFTGGSVSGSWRYAGETDRNRKDAGKEGKEIAWRRNLEIFLMETDDAWARDIGPTFLVANGPAAGEENGAEGKNAADDRLRAVNWKFNAWGGETDGLYAHWEKDDAFAGRFCAKYGYPLFEAAPFVMEGGAVHSDGEGTLLVTEECLLSPGRNPGMDKSEIEDTLKAVLGAEKVIWLPWGMAGDETNGHVDNICAFLKPGEVVLAWTDDTSDLQYARSEQCLACLKKVTDARGRKLCIRKLPLPQVPVCITREDLDGYVFEEGEEERQVGERLAASYVNFYFSNDAILLPAFGGANADSDAQAAALMQTWNPGRTVRSVPARDILTGGGNIHCITQQIPRV